MSMSLFLLLSQVLSVDAAAAPNLVAEGLMSTCTDPAGHPAVRVFLRNTGDAVAEAFYVDVYAHEEGITEEHFAGVGDFWVWVGGVEPGEAREVLVPMAGTEKRWWDIAVRLDLEDYVSEGSEVDNILYSWHPSWWTTGIDVDYSAGVPMFDCDQTPDLEVETLEIRWIDGSRHAVATVRNAGLGAAPSTGLWIDACPDAFLIPPLAGGAALTANCKLRSYIGAGPRTVRSYTDSSWELDELDERNLQYWSVVVP